MAILENKRRFKPLFLALAAGAASATAALVARGLVRPRAPAPAHVGTALDGVNDAFHEGYGRARLDASDEVPFFVVLADELVLVRGDTRSSVTFTPRLFHVVKSVAHAPLALYLAVLNDGPENARSLSKETLARVRLVREKVIFAITSLDDETDAEPRADGTVRNLASLLTMVLAFADDLLSGKGATNDALDSFAARTSPLLTRCTEDATRVQLAALNRHVAHFVADMTADERLRFHVVVTGDHQARRRSFGMQYFAALVGGGDAAEKRVAYGEGVTDVDGAIALVSTQRLNRTIAAAFFGDEARLQEDVLGDAVRDALPSLALPPLM